jgi:hypothetical protein
LLLLAAKVRGCSRGYIDRFFHEAHAAYRSAMAGLFGGIHLLSS